MVDCGESTRGRVLVHRHVLYLGEVNDRQKASWEKAVSVVDESSGTVRQLELLPEDRVITPSGLMPRAVFEKLATVQILDVRVPTTDGRELLLIRRTEPAADATLVLQQLGLDLPAQLPPRIRTACSVPINSVGPTFQTLDL